VVRGKGRPKGSKNKKGYQLTNTRRDPSQFEYTSSLALAVLSRQPTESAAVRGLLAQDEQEDDGFIDIEAFDEALIDP
jgi:hypothetical protein